MRIPTRSRLMVLAVTAVALAAAGGGAPRMPIPTHRPNLEIMMCAHRGVKKKAPENTIHAIQKAIDLGYSYVEIDVRYTKDGVPVLMHDAWVNRTTSGFGPLRLYDLERLQKLDAGRWKAPGFMGARVPTVEEALELMEGRINLYLDQKQPPRPELIRLLKEQGFYPDRMVIVGGGEFTREFLRLEPDAPVMPKLHDAGEAEALLEQFPSAKAFNTDCEVLTPEMVDAAHSRGVMVFTNVLAKPPWVERECMRKPILYGSDVVQFDNVDLFFEVLEELRSGHGD